MFTNPNLLMAMNIIHDRVTEKQVLTKLQESTAALGEKLYLASMGSNPECVIAYNAQFGLIVSEAKDIYAGPMAACAKIVSFSGSFAMKQVAHGVPRNRVLVPFVQAFSEALQFGAAYVVDSNFPCTVMLTPPLSLLNWETRNTICRWLLALARFCDRQVTVFRERRLPYPPSEDTLNVRAVFLKHVTTERESHDHRTARYCVSQLLQIFQFLHLHGRCRSFVVFPLGVMGLPDQGDDLRAPVINALVTAHPRQQAALFKLPVGWPIVIYPRLALPEWQCAAQVRDLYLHRDSFVAQLTAMLGYVAEAGIIHLDVRLTNIMVKLPSTTSSGSSSSASAMQLKIIDWDESAPVGHAIAPSLLLAFELDGAGKDAADLRYPLNEPIATAAYHTFFLQRIDKLLREQEAREGREGANAEESGRLRREQLR